MACYIPYIHPPQALYYTKIGYHRLQELVRVTEHGMVIYSIAQHIQLPLYCQYNLVECYERKVYLGNSRLREYAK
jgi:hypothetical protein